MAGEISWVEFRADCCRDGVRVALVNGETGITLQEDFDNDRLLCPLTGKPISIEQVLKSYEQARTAVQVLIATLHYAHHNVRSGGGNYI